MDVSRQKICTRGLARCGLANGRDDGRGVLLAHLQANTVACSTPAKETSAAIFHSPGVEANRAVGKSGLARRGAWLRFGWLGFTHRCRREEGQGLNACALKLGLMWFLVHAASLSRVAILIAVSRGTARSSKKIVFSPRTSIQPCFTWSVVRFADGFGGSLPRAWASAAAA